MQIKQLPKRLQSIDVFRAITMLLMIFVNDASSVKEIPVWIDHVAGIEDGLGFADTVFPAFLFIAGLSLPFAIRNRINKGHAFFNILFYISTRAFALVVIGFFHVNSENYNAAAAVLPQPVWIITITLAFFLIWLDYGPLMTNIKKYNLIAGGVILLIAMAIIYKGGTADEPTGMKPYWWGILGIIGWAYLVCAVIFLITKGRLYLLVVAYAAAIFINVAYHTGLLKLNLPLIGDASSISLMLGGTVLSVLYGKLVSNHKDRFLWTVFIGIGVMMILAGLIIRPYAEGISKIRATPAWVFICTGISILFFTATIWLIDVKGKQNWFSLIRPAGTSTLTCYLVPYFLYSVYTLLHFRYPPFLNYGMGGLIRSFVIAFLVILLTGFLEKKRLRLKV
jgi:heparan-alpha-glucosaminide N-acetyltransferase